MSEILIEFENGEIHRTEDFDEFKYYCFHIAGLFWTVDGKLYSIKNHDLVGQWSIMD